MKKLALALVCLVSVAFFASCTPEGQPTISVLPGEEYVHDGDVINVNEEFNIGFVMASSIETGQQLASLTIVIDDQTFETVKLEGTEYTYEKTLALNYDEETRDDMKNLVITATVTDVVGQTASVTLTLNIDETQGLVATPFEWYRLGLNITGLDEFGLSWKGNYPRDTYAKLEPKEGVRLYIFNSEDWTNTTNVVDKAALFNKAIEEMNPAQEYFNVNVTQAEMTYDDVIGTIMPDGTCHLIHVTKSTASYLGSQQGTEITISGEAK